MGGATVESDCIIAANAVVLQGQTVPEGHVAYGSPAETKPITDDQLDQIDSTRDHYVDLGLRLGEPTAESKADPSSE
jgi:carbonic anhydrase/acetyltransferase-like protein (isoleucine patch superfamily)